MSYINVFLIGVVAGILLSVLSYTRFFKRKLPIFSGNDNNDDHELEDYYHNAKNFKNTTVENNSKIITEIEKLKGDLEALKTIQKEEENILKAEKEFYESVLDKEEGLKS